MDSEGLRERLVESVKDQQRSSEIAREGWRHYCAALGSGIQDPAKHTSEFLQEFLDVLKGDQLPKREDSFEPRLVRSSCPSLGSEQLEIFMPESELGVLKDVVNANCYGLAPGRACVLCSGDVLLDVGAHVGTASALALKTPGVAVVCVEPHPLSFDLLCRNLAGAKAVLLNLALSDSSGVRSLYAHRGTNNPSRLFFASLFPTRSHADDAIKVQCVSLQELITAYTPSVIKIDAEGAERYIASIKDFGAVRRLVVEWDWAHNRHREVWEDTKRTLETQGFKLSIRGRMPDFDDVGNAILTDARNKKRGNTGMIFLAARKPSSIHKASLKTRPEAPPEHHHLPEKICWTEAPRDAVLTSEMATAFQQPQLASQLEALSIEQMEERLIHFKQSVRPVAAEEYFAVGFKEHRRTELVQALCEAYREQPRIVERSPGVPLPAQAVGSLLDALRQVKFEENARPSVHASGYLILKAQQAAKFAKSWGEERLLAELWDLVEQILRSVSPKAGQFHFTAMALTKNFHASPHVDQNDLSVQYALSVGSFDEGGELCVEANPHLICCLDTRNRIVCIDGRFPHWVSGYTGERFSIICYRTSGDYDPPTQAVHPV